MLLPQEGTLLLLILYYSLLIYIFIFIPFSSNTLCNKTSGIWYLFSHPFPAGKGEHTAACYVPVRAGTEYVQFFGLFLFSYTC